MSYSIIVEQKLTSDKVVYVELERDDIVVYGSKIYRENRHDHDIFNTLEVSRCHNLGGKFVFHNVQRNGILIVKASPEFMSIITGIARFTGGFNLLCTLVFEAGGLYRYSLINRFNSQIDSLTVFVSSSPHYSIKRDTIYLACCDVVLSRTEFEDYSYDPDTGIVLRRLWTHKDSSFITINKIRGDKLVRCYSFDLPRGCNVELDAMTMRVREIGSRTYWQITFKYEPKTLLQRCLEIVKSLQPDTDSLPNELKEMIAA
jgi:hypothetical protein